MFTAIVAVACGGALGATARFLTVTFARFAFGGDYPIGTLMVNSLGSFLAGLIMILLLERFPVSDYWHLFLVVGFLGAFTTFSSYSWETWMLYQNKDIVSAALNILCNNIFALGLALSGIILGRWIGGTAL
ncbi:fluoride efflux transporter CrcB [Legionella spiritensis]|uniref:fluoride efflux transporter CrcB n=1 Tax=Legionella spiritensis TaxID=452 RepID=UPI000F6D596F|nr:fluoride efflux transporter CrcB [Legionella spiritensis]VEG92223.1 protein crcB homolog [Legionella spiritensis]